MEANKIRIQAMNDSVSWGMSDFFDLISRAADAGYQVGQADVNSIFRHGRPNEGASEAEIISLEQCLGYALPERYRMFLGYCDGWTGFYESMDLFSTGVLGDDNSRAGVWLQVEAWVAGAGEASIFSSATHLPIGSSGANFCVCLLEVRSGSVVWLNGSSVEEFATLDGFIEKLTEYHEETLAELRRDPWIGLA